jgi:hypothetical protein
MVNIIHIVPLAIDQVNDIPMWFGVYELPLATAVNEDMVRLQSPSIDFDN